jgi:GNAT superfamily N-acetyltransferase
MQSAAQSQTVGVRAAAEADAARIAELSGQLGYPSTTEDILRRMASLVPVANHALIVAETPAGEVIGWVHVSVNPLVESDLRAEINGLVVAEGQRNLGAGRLLLEEAERWARDRGCRSVSLRSNVIRDRAHRFYERNGYEHYKTQKAFRKAL